MQMLGEKDMQPHDSDANRRREEILLRRLRLAEELHDLTVSESEAIESKDWDRIKGLLHEKDKRIREFQGTEKSLGTWKPLGNGVDGDPLLKTVLSRIQSKLEAVQSLEEVCQRALGTMKDQTAKALHDIRRSREAIRRFKPRRSRVPRFVDLHR
jgi:hypothetical protein